MRAAFSRAIVAAAASDHRVLLLTGDHGYSLFDEFRRVAPEQFINAGVAEQNMVGVAAGLAKAGFRPIVYGLSAFVPIRVLEQIKLDVCYEKLPVVFIGDGAGLVYSSLGSSHQSTEDVAALRAIPNLQILSPGDRHEMAYAMEQALRASGPTYIRMGKADQPDVHSDELSVPLGNLIALRSPVRQDIAIVATGSMLNTALSLSDALGNPSVWSAPSIVPLNQSQLQSIAQSSETLIVIEEHACVGGLGGAIAETVGEMPHHRPRVIRLGSEARFSQKCGSYSYLLKEHRLDVGSLLERLRDKGIRNAE